MTNENLQNLIQTVINNKFETQHIEIKTAYDGVPKKLYDTLSAFSNQTNGGIIIFGINEAANFKITGVTDIQNLQKKVSEQCRAMTPEIHPIFNYINIDGKNIVVLEVPECNILEKPCYYTPLGMTNGCFIRVGESDTHMTPFEIYTFEVYKRRIHDELRPVENTSIKDLSNIKINEFLQAIKIFKPRLAQFNSDEILKLQNILTENDVVTLLGYLLFNIFPQKKFPRLCITASVIPGNELGERLDNTRFLDNIKIEGTIPEILEESIGFISRNMTKKVEFDKQGHRINSIEYPIIAIRESVLNALIHRDYSFFTENIPIEILMFKNRIEIISPGELYGGSRIEDLGLKSLDVRNPHLSSALEILINSENRYSGIPTIRKEMKLAGLLPPVFKSGNGIFKTILFNANKLLENESLDNEILAFCSTPRSRDELAKKFNINSMPYFISRYMQPLIIAGKIKETLPEKPKSKNQRYYTV